jgi:uncharacterized protein YkwD
MRSAVVRLRGMVAALLLVIVAMPCAASASAASPRVDRTEATIVRALNHVRSQYHLAPLRLNSKLARAADAHSAAMARTGQISHGAMNSRLRRYTHAHAIGEALAWYSTCNAHKIVSMWMASAPHRAILLAGRFDRIGVGRRVGHGLCLVTADVSS